MMKLVYRVYVVALILLTCVFVVAAQTPSPTPRATTTVTYTGDARSARDPRNTAPTVGTGGTPGGPTGLFTVYDGQTLRAGEFTFSVAISNYDRDPGNVDITEVPVSFQVGLTNRFELFFNIDAYRAVKVNSPRNLSSFYLPNSRIGGVSPGAIVLAPGTGGVFANQPVYRPIGTAPFVQYPFTGGSAGNFGFTLPGIFSGPFFGFPAGTIPTLGPPRSGGGEGADLFPGVGSVFGSILPGVVLQTICTGAPTPPTCAPGATTPTVFTVAPSYLPDAPFINRTYGESAFSTLTGGFKWRWTGIHNPVGVGLIGYFKWYMDDAEDFGGFNQLQRGASPGGNRGLFGIPGDLGLTLFADARLARWANLSANIGYQRSASVRDADDFTLLDRGDELSSAVGLDFPVNRYFQPILEFRSLSYIGGRTPNAFENNPLDGLAGVRIFPARWIGFGFAYRHHFNQQDDDAFDEDETFTSNIFLPCAPNLTGCVPRTQSVTFTGVPPGFVTSSDPHGYIIQFFAGRRKPRAEEVLNQAANVTALDVSDTEIRIPCPPGTVPRAGTACADSTTVSVTTTAVDPENDILTYNYTVSGGRIVGTGATVEWDLSGAAPGTYTITAGVDDGCGICGRTETRTVTIVACDCVTACVCPTVTVTGPAGITNPGDTMTFTASAVGGSWTPTNYNWTVSAGTIESGQGTPSITVRTTRDMAGTNVTATVDIGPSPADCPCPVTAFDSAPVAGLPEAVLVNEFGDLIPDQIRAQLDNFFAELQNNPDQQGYIINYGTDRQIANRERLILNHINFRNFDRSRITLVRGGDRGAGPETRLYRIPPGAENPIP